MGGNEAAGALNSGAVGPLVGTPSTLGGTEASGNKMPADQSLLGSGGGTQAVPGGRRLQQVNPDAEDFAESNLMHGMNGFVYGNMPVRLP